MPRKQGGCNGSSFSGGSRRRRADILGGAALRLREIAATATSRSGSAYSLKGVRKGGKAEAGGITRTVSFPAP